jgi:hypothetical protein
MPVEIGSSAGRKMRPRTFMEMQPYIVAYGAGISLFSPIASVYQLCRLNPQVAASNSRMASLAARVFPIQTLLKTIQMNVSTPVKENLNPWAAFAVIGVIQGGVYGQCNIYFSKQLEISKNLSLAGMFRGVLFAATRDTISQGVPFMCSGIVKKNIFEPLLPTAEGDVSQSAEFKRAVKHWGSVLSTSVVSTIASQGVHNCQITMQANQELSYMGTLKTVWERNGVAAFYRGSEARIGLLLTVNILNELLLKPAWSPVPED